LAGTIRWLIPLGTAERWPDGSVVVRSHAALIAVSCQLSTLVIGILGEIGQNLPGGVHQTKGVRFLPGMAPGYIMRPQLSGCDRLGGARQDRGFPLYKNAFLEPIDCEQFDLLHTGDWRAAMDADVERFFEECRADPWFRDQPEALKGHEEIFEEFYLYPDSLKSR
jgi:hypothetical protein